MSLNVILSVYRSIVKLSRAGFNLVPHRATFKVVHAFLSSFAVTTNSDSGKTMGNKGVPAPHWLWPLSLKRVTSGWTPGRKEPAPGITVGRLHTQLQGLVAPPMGS